tara:strand:+ start:10 stop:144 length:135 start_codon:yes stop_codon:yes gene_type:complete
LEDLRLANARQVNFMAVFSSVFFSDADELIPYALGSNNNGKLKQ